MTNLAMPPLLAMAEFTPLLGAVMICWILSVCVHEYAHAIVAYWGGDTTVKERGHLSNVFSYIDPVTSLLLPVIFLAMGGIPMPGGAVRINRALLRSRGWDSLVSAAGPAANIMLFLILAVIIHPSTGLIDFEAPSPPTWARLLGAMTVLQLISVFFNLIPIPPLDGFGIIRPFMDYRSQAMFNRIGLIGLFVLFFVLFRFDPVRDGFFEAVDWVLRTVGLTWKSTWGQYNVAFFGSE